MKNVFSPSSSTLNTIFKKIFKPRMTVLAAAISCAVSGPIYAQSQTFTTFQYPNSSITTVTGIRADNMTGNYSTGIDSNTGGLLFDLSTGAYSAFPYATTNGSNFPNATSSTPYGPNFGSSAGILRVVGSYKTAASGSDNLGYLYDGATVSGAQITTLVFPVTGVINTLAHSNFGNQAVGNYDTRLATGNGFIYNISTGAYSSINKPGAKSTTAYGIYANRIAGGYGDSPLSIRGYIYNQDTQIFSSYSAPTGHFFTHFEGITGGGRANTFNLIADSVDAKGQLHGWVIHVDQLGQANWIEIKYGDYSLSANSIYQNKVIGVYVDNGVVKAYETDFPGIYDPIINSTVINNTSPNGSGIFSLGDDIINNGVINTSGSNSQGVSSGSYGVITNNGTISASGANSAAILMSGTFGTLLNNGRISASSGAYAILTDPTSMGTVVVNKGTIDGQVSIVAGPYARFENSGWLGVTNAGVKVTHLISGTFAQTPTGTLSLRFSPAATDTLIVGGTAILSGALNLQTTPGIYNTGDAYRVLTAGTPVVGKFTSVTQPTELAAGTQLLPLYNTSIMGFGSVDLTVMPTSYSAMPTLQSSNANTRSVAAALDKLMYANQTGQTLGPNDQLLFAASKQTPASLTAFAASLTGEVLGAALTVVPQTTLRVQQSVLARLEDQTSAVLMSSSIAPTTNSSITATNPGGQPIANISSNLSVNATANNVTNASASNGTTWGEIAYQRGNRSSDSIANGFSSNLYQLVFGADTFTENGIRAGGGFALSNTNVYANSGSGTVQQGSVFLYGKLPVDTFIFDAMASYGMNSTDHSRSDYTGFSSGLSSKGVGGNDALLSVGMSRPVHAESVVVTPYARVTWQQVTQSSFTEGASAAALNINSFNASGVRGVLGLAVGSKAINPMTEKYTYRVNVGVGADSSNLLNPTLNASLSGAPLTIATANAGTTFVQAGLFGTAKISDNSFAYLGIAGEFRSGSTLGNVSAGVRIQF